MKEFLSSKIRQRTLDCCCTKPLISLLDDEQWCLLRGEQRYPVKIPSLFHNIVIRNTELGDCILGPSVSLLWATFPAMCLTQAANSYTVGSDIKQSHQIMGARFSSHLSQQSHMHLYKANPYPSLYETGSVACSNNW